MTTLSAQLSNERARLTWNTKPVGSQRSQSLSGSAQYFAEMRAYRYGYETPFIPRIHRFADLRGKDVLEIGVGNGIDAVEMASHGARYTGIDVTERHLELARRNFAVNLPDQTPTLIRGDLLECEFDKKFDVIYSFGVMHHIAHEAAFYRRMHDLLRDDGALRIAVYSKYSFFNAYLWATWLLKTRGRIPLHDWQSHVTESSELGSPVTIAIRSKRQVAKLLASCGWKVTSYHKRGFVQRYLPVVGPRFLHPDGYVLNALGSALGWYHIFECRKSPKQVSAAASVPDVPCQSTKVEYPSPFVSEVAENTTARVIKTRAFGWRKRRVDQTHGNPS